MLPNLSSGPRSPIMIDAIDVEWRFFTRRTLVKQFGFNAGGVLAFARGARSKVDLLHIVTAVGAGPVTDPEAESSLSRHDTELLSNLLLNQPGGAQAYSGG